MRKILLFAFLAAASGTAFADPVYYVELSYPAGRITSFEVAVRGSERFRPVSIDSQPGEGSGGTFTVALRKGDAGCLRDLRIGFADGRRIVRRDFDVCKLAKVQVGESLLLAAQP